LTIPWERPAGNQKLSRAERDLLPSTWTPSAEQTQRGTTRGAFLATALRGSHTPLYALPEQMRGDDPDPVLVASANAPGPDTPVATNVRGWGLVPVGPLARSGDWLVQCRHD
jgi:hypothetical protein